MYLGVCDGNMQEGSFRCDANVSVRIKGSNELGVKVELKNMNSFKFIEDALEYEIKRQIFEIEQGGEIVQETRLWDTSKQMTFTMRRKETASDYRYFPDPDLPSVIVDEAILNDAKENFPELPWEKAERFAREYGLRRYDIDILISHRTLSDYFEEVVKRCNDPRMAANWIISELLRELKFENLVSVNMPIRAEYLAELIVLLKSGKINNLTAKDVFSQVLKSGESPIKIVEEKGLSIVGDKEELEEIVKKVFEENPKEFERLKGGEMKLVGFFMGQVMKATKGRANPKSLKEIILRFAKSD